MSQQTACLLGVNFCRYSWAFTSYSVFAYVYNELGSLEHGNPFAMLGLGICYVSWDYSALGVSLYNSLCIILSLAIYTNTRSETAFFPTAKVVLN